MAALEYLTENSLTSHPLKSRKYAAVSSPNPIEYDWFYDILFISFSDTIRSVYISNITKHTDGSLSISFNNAESLESICEMLIATENVVDHYKNIAKSFAHFSTQTGAIKVLLGPGLVSKGAFNQNYTKDEAELSSSAVVLNCPRLNKLTFKTYAPDVSSEPFEVYTYSYPGIPNIELRANTEIAIEGPNSIGWYAQTGLGTGLYDACPETLGITELYSINGVVPNSEGALFFNSSSCYSSSLLTSNMAALLGAYSSGGYLYNYKHFNILTGPNQFDSFDALNIGHSIVLQNFCKPKCPPENLNAFAYYLNRVTDGAAELDKIVSSNSETRGIGAPLQNNPTVFSAFDFCVDSDTTFARCTDPSLGSARIDCNPSFIKYYHEARTLQIFYNNLTIRNYIIVEVIDANTVRLDLPPTQTGEPLSFRVIDNGVFSNMNCAASAYNLDAATYTHPYFKVKYTTAESYNSSGDYVTYLSISLAIFNPSTSIVSIRADFTNSEVLKALGSFKIRTQDNIVIAPTAAINVACREYAFIEAVYYINCGTTGGALDIEVFQTVQGVDTQLGSTYSLRNISGTECPGTVAGTGVIKRVLQSTGASFNEDVALSDKITSVVLYGSKPSWLLFTPVYAAHKINLSAASAPTETESLRYSMYFRSYGGDIPGVISQLVIDYVAYPQIISPLASRYTQDAPLALNKKTTYTLDSPLFQIAAVNMTKLSNDFPTDDFAFIYTATGIPTGLSIDASSGKVIGKLDDSYSTGSTLVINISASNPAGNATNPQSINLIVPYDEAPTVSFDSSTPGPSFSSSNLFLYTTDSPLIKFVATNPPIYRYVLTGTLPSGLAFNPTLGVISGQISGTQTGAYMLSVHAVNYNGISNELSFNIIYTEVYNKPTITAPLQDAEYSVPVDSSTTKESPLFKVTATNADGSTQFIQDCNSQLSINSGATNYTAIGLPLGFTLDSCSGDFYGGIDPSTLPDNYSSNSSYYRRYPVRVYANNIIGSVYSDVYINIYSTGVPIINNIAPNRKITTSRTTTYTLDNPLFKIAALNSPTSFYATDLPPGLVCLNTGEIVGRIDPNIFADDYPVSLYASNASGTSAPVTCILNVQINISLDNPPTNNTYNVVVGRNYQQLVTAISSGAAQNDSILMSSSSILPTGLTLTANVIAGQLSANAKLGAYPVRIVATSTYHGSAYVDFVIYVKPLSYALFGFVFDNDGNPVAGVTISDGNNDYATTDSFGFYSMQDIPKGSYNVQASKDSYLFTPRYIPVTVVNSDIYNLNFISEGPLRQVTGTVTLQDGTPLGFVSVGDGEHTSTTNSFGSFELYVAPDKVQSITPSLLGYIFDPSFVNIPAGGSSVTGLQFVASPAQAPTNPTITNVTLSGDTSSIYFDPPNSDGGSYISNYQYSLNNGVNWINCSPASTTSPIVVTGLSNGTTYRIKIRAINSAGIGKASNAWYFTVSATPAAPTITDVVSSDSQLQILFAAPLDNGGQAIANYEYTLDSGATWAARIPARTDSPINIAGLTNGVEYVLAVRAVNNNGAGAASQYFRATPAKTSTAPIITSILPGDGLLVVYFNPPSNTGGAVITNYIYSVDGGTTYNTPEPPIVSSPLTIANLTNGAKYSIVIAAVSSAGTGQASAIYTATPAAAPEAPTITNYTLPQGGGGALIYFTPGGSGGSPITDYKYQIYSSDVWGEAIALNSTTSPVILTGLQNDTTLVIRLVAVNITGSSLPSNSITVRVAVPPPILTAMTNVTATSIVLSPEYATANNVAGLEINFTPPNNIDSTFDHYECNQDNTTWTAIPSTYPGLYLDRTAPFNIDISGRGKTISLKFRGVNAGGAGAASSAITVLAAGVPYAPTNLVASPGVGSISLSFKPPTNNGGSAITNYEYYLDSGWIRANRTTSPITITGLTNGQFYNITLRAVNQFGGGNTSTASATPRTVPDAPSLLTATSLPSGGLSISFAEPNNRGAAITDYVYSTNDGVNFASAARANEPILITTTSTGTPLINGVTYNIILKAVNIVGRSSSSAPVTGTPYAAPGAPTINSITSPTGGKLRVTYTLNTDTGGAAISDVLYSINGGAYISTKNTNGAITIGGLTNGATYSITLKSQNSVNFTSPPSSAASGAPITTAPSAPINIAAVPGNRQITLNFDPPTETGGESILYYEYNLTGGDYTGSTYISTNSNNTTFTVSGLTNGQTYAISLRAVNSFGFGPAATASGVIPRTIPSAPQAFSVTPNYGNLGAVLNFTTPTDNGGSPIIGYAYTINGGDSFVSTSQTTSPIIVTDGIIEGQSYRAAVRAITAAGQGFISNAYIFSAISLANAPTISAVTTASGALTIAFTPPTASGSLNISYYKYSIDGGVSYVSSLFNSSPFTITSGKINGVTVSLTNGTTYSVAIKAVTADGDGLASNIVSQMVGAQPGAPTFAAGYKATPKPLTGANGKIEVILNAAPAGTTPTLRYESAVISAGITPTWQTQAVSFGSNNIAIVAVSRNWLALNTAYAVQIRAVNSLGAGEPTPVSEYVKFGVPSAPTVITSYQSSILYVYNPGGYGGGYSVGYTGFFQISQDDIDNGVISPVNSMIGLKVYHKSLSTQNTIYWGTAVATLQTATNPYGSWATGYYAYTATLGTSTSPGGYSSFAYAVSLYNDFGEGPRSNMSEYLQT